MLDTDTWHRVLSAVDWDTHISSSVSCVLEGCNTGTTMTINSVALNFLILLNKRQTPVFTVQKVTI